jgi:phage major head subunit gpT-like protein
MSTVTASAKSKTQSWAGVHIPENFEDVCKTGLDDVFKRTMEMPEQGKQFFKTRNMTKRSEKFLSYFGLGEVQQVTDTEDIPADEMGLGFDWTLTNNIYKGKINITKELIEDEMYGVINDRQQELSQSYKATVEAVLADVFNRSLGASGAPFACDDGLYLGDSARPNPYALAGTWSNLESAGAITVASLTQAQLNFKSYKNERGQLRPLKMKALVIRPEDEQNVWEILKSEKEPTSSLNKKNYQQDKFEYIVYDYLTSAVNFFIAEDAGGAKNELYFGDRISPEIRTWWDEDVMVQRIRARFGVGCGRPYIFRFQDVS